MALFTLYADCYGVDTNTVLTAQKAKALAINTVLSKPIKFVFRYVSLSAPFGRGDITVAERDAILGAGLALGLVQHVNWPGWVANAANGAQHGEAAVAHAQSIGYPQACAIGLDMEGVADSGQPVLDYVIAWAAAVHAAGYTVLLYNGYACGLTPDQLAQLKKDGHVGAFWKDFGPRKPPTGYAFSLVQMTQQTMVGQPCDPDHYVGPDTIILMAADPAAAPVIDESPLPANPVQTDVKAVEAQVAPVVTADVQVAPAPTDPVAAEQAAVDALINQVVTP